MSDSLTLNLALDVDELMTEFMPKVAKELMRHAATGDFFSGTEMSLVVDISGHAYSYVLKDGNKLEATKGALENAQAKVFISLDDLHKLILLKNVDLFMGIPTDSVSQAKDKQHVVDEIKGRLGLELTNDDESVSKVSVVLNNCEEPHAIFKLTMEDARQLMSGKLNPVSMFMGGQLQIEGDIGFAMSLQPLFT